MITVNIDKAKAVSHDLRRKARAEEFAPLDDVIAKRIPGKDPDQVELERQAIRDKFAEIQSQIDACQDAAALRQIVKTELGI